MKCAKCGSISPLPARFCSQCGAPLEPEHAGKQKGQRRPVAVVFADLSGFTALSEKMDPEEVKDLIDSCMKKLAACVNYYEGYIDKFIGDCIMAVFGAPVAHEDDPLRAVLSALDMVREIELIGRSTRLPLAINIGINYGLVATGDLGRPGAYTVMGDTVNLAQRLQSAATGGKIYVSESAYRHTKNEIRYRRHGKIMVKGKQQPITVYVPQAVIRRFSMRQIRESPFIGRKSELGRLVEAYRAVLDGHGQVVSIMGEAGIGKSKLVYELKQTLDEKIELIEGKGIEYLRTSPYYVVKEMLKKIFAIEEYEPPSVAAQKIKRRIALTRDPSLIKTLPLFQYLLSADLTRPEYNRIEAMKPDDRVRLIDQSIGLLFLQLPKKHPAVIIFDDNHWIDKESINLMHQLARAIEDRAILLVNIYRPEFKSDVLAKIDYCTTIQLKPLPATDAVALMRKIFNCDKIEDRLQQLLVEKSGGLPFYLHELAGNLLQNDLVKVERGTARLKGSGALSIPRTLDELIMTRIDRLDDAQRRIVDVAAVIGDDFSRQLLEELVHQGRILSSRIDGLCDAGILVPLVDEKTVDHNQERYGFRHSIIRDAVYGSILKKELRKMHLAVGYAMEKLCAANIAEFEDALADHFLQGEETGKAIEHLERAADNKRKLNLNEPARKLYQQILELTAPSDREVRLRAYEKIGELYNLTGDYDRALASYGMMEKTGAGDALIASRALNAMALIQSFQGRREHALATLARARAVVDAAPGCSKTAVTIEKASILSKECWILRLKGQLANAEEKGLEAIALLKAIKTGGGRVEWKTAMADINNNLATLYCDKGDFDKAIALCKDALTIVEEQGNQQGKGSIYNILGTIYRIRGQYDDAIRAFEMKLKISDDLGDKKGAGIAYINLGNVYQNNDNPVKAYELFEKHLKISEELENKPWMAKANCNLGIVHHDNCDYPRAVSAFKDYLNISRELGDKKGEATAANNLGEVYVSVFEYEKARTLFRAGLKISEELGDEWLKAVLLNNLANIYLHEGRYDKAAENLRAARGYFESVNHRISLSNTIGKTAELKLHEGKLDEALSLARTALKMAEEMRTLDTKLSVLQVIGRIYGRMLALLEPTGPGCDKKSPELFRNVVETFTLGLSIARGLKNKRQVADTLYDYGQVLAALKKNNEARKFLNDAMKLYREMGIAGKVKFPATR